MNKDDIPYYYCLTCWSMFPDSNLVGKKCPYCKDKKWTKVRFKLTKIGRKEVAENEH